MLHHAAELSEWELPEPVWREFAASTWELTPRVLKKAFRAPILTATELFDALLVAAHSYRATSSPNRRASQRFAVRHATLMTDVERYLAHPSDGSLQGYLDRLDRELRGEPFELIVNEFQEHSVVLWSRLCDFVRNCYRRVGLPAGRAEAALFLRKQNATSFGVHKDDASVFLFPLAGNKRILAWAPEAFGARTPTLTLDYEPFRHSATCLSAEPGDVTYWPSSHWHVGEAGNELSISINLGLHQEGDAGSDLRAALEHVVVTAPDDLHFENFPDDIPCGAVSLPDGVEEMLASVGTAARNGDLERAFRLVRLNRITGSGFKRLPPRAELQAIRDEDVILLRAAVAWTPWRGGEIACSSGGRSFAVPDTPGLRRLLERLRRGQTYAVGSLLAEIESHEAEGLLLRSVLSRLTTLHAVTTVPRETTS